MWEEEANRKPNFQPKSLTDFPSEVLSMDPALFRLLVLGGSFIPGNWTKDSPYPYQGLLIAAAYFHAAKTAEESNSPTDAYALLVHAYYYLGTNSSSQTVQESALVAAQTRHQRHSGNLQHAVLEVLTRLESDPTIASIAEARRRVCVAFQEPRYSAIFELFSDATEGLQKDRAKPASDRLAELLARWCIPSGGYPDIVRAFARFKRTSRRMPR
jgi:hypothetical protein